jgi:putative salt-induced outer membrane protein YdiY
VTEQKFSGNLKNNNTERKKQQAMKKNRFISCALSVSMLLSAAAMPIVSADDEQQEVSSSWTENMNRGLVAVPTSNGIYLSWRLQEDEDSRFGNGEDNVSFDIYRDDVKIATEAGTTN